MDFQPRVVRLKDAPKYLGMDKNRFNLEVRPFLTEVPVGKQGVGFDKVDLDAWFDEYKKLHGRPGKGGRCKKWDAKEAQGSSREVAFGTSKKQSKVTEFEKAVERATSQKPSDI